MRLVSSRVVDLFPNANKIRFFVYKRLFDLEYFTRIHHNVIIGAHHKAPDTFKKINKYGLKIGKNCLFENNVDLDTSGNVIIGDNVVFVVDSIIYSHSHEVIYNKNVRESKLKCYNLEIDDDVQIGARAILVGCTRIGRFANIGAGSVVRSNVPPYAIVIGNPAKIVGFKFSPDEMVNYEKERYRLNERTPLDYYTQLYEKYFKNRRKEIKSFIKL